MNREFFTKARNFLEDQFIEVEYINQETGSVVPHENVTKEIFDRATDLEIMEDKDVFPPHILIVEICTICGLRTEMPPQDVDSYHTEECELNTLMDGLDELELMYAHIKVAKRRIQWINDIVEDEGS